MKTYKDAFEYREQLIGARWIDYERLQSLSTTHLIDHMMSCQYLSAEALNREPYRDEHKDDHTVMWAAYGNQAMWCLQILFERGIYEAQPYRDDKTQEYLKALNDDGL